MGEAKRKAANVMISVLIPERGRPEMLERLIDSLCEKAGVDQRYEILVSVDDDDPAWANQPPHQPWSARRPVMWFHGPRAPTLGVKINALARQARGDIVWFIANDYVTETDGWPAKFRDAVAKLPNGIGYPFVHDDLHPDHAAFPLMTRKMIDAVGFMFPPWFGVGWFTDTWADQCGILLGVRPEIDVTVRAPEGRGKTHGLKDVTFWATFFREMLPFRSRDALGLAKLAYGDDSAGFADVKAKLADREVLCEARTRHLITPEFADIWESNAASPPAPSYLRVKENAEEMLRNLRAAKPKRQRIAIACPSGRVWEATTGNCIAAMAAHSAIAGIDICMLNVQSSDISHGRNTTVQIARESGCSGICWIDADMKFPPDLLIRLLAWDQPVVGALYCKRVQDKTGKYPMLGRLVGPKPDVMDDGLHEALLMPGGLMFVRMEVYDTLGWPAYAFVYRWPGDDGLEAFKTMMRQYFSVEPPEDALAELDGTKFGEWLRTGYTVGEFGDPAMTFSEDLYFSRRCRKAGIKLFADIRLTGECSHLGEHEVTCLLGPEIVRLQDAAD